MNIENIHGVTRNIGIMAPGGRKYVPASRAELRAILSRVSSTGTTGAVGRNSPTVSQTQVHHDYVSFHLGPDLHYVDLITADEDIRSRRLGDIATELPYEDAP